MTILQTPRLNIKPYQLNDAASMFALVNRNQAHLAAYFPTVLAVSCSIASCVDFITAQIQSLETKEKISYGIFDTNSNQYIGHIFLKSIEWRVPKGEVGYFIDQDWQGQGLVTEALIAFCQHCFDDWKLEKIFLRTTAYNLASQRVALKAGFEQEGLLRSDFRTGEGVLEDVLYFGLLNKEI